MSDRWSRLAPLTGVVFAALVVGIFATSGTTPNSKASGAAVIAFYEAHRTRQRTVDILFAFAALFLVLYAGAVRSRFRRVPSAEALGSVVVAGASLLALGLMVWASIDFALADVPNRLSVNAAQALNILGNDFVFPVAIGGCLFALGAAIGILRGAGLPKWLGWVAIVIAIAMVTPAFPIGLLGITIWTLITSILLWTRASHSPAEIATSEPLPT
jgi:hypothetical protein